MRDLIREWPRLDPRTGIAVFALWALLFGLTLVGPGRAFDQSSIFGDLRHYVDEQALGGGMLGSALLLVWSIRPQSRLTPRLLIGGICGTFWMLVGVLLLSGAWRSGLFSSAGAFSLIGGVGCIITLWQWTARA